MCQDVSATHTRNCLSSSNNLLCSSYLDKQKEMEEEIDVEGDADDDDSENNLDIIQQQK